MQQLRQVFQRICRRPSRHQPSLFGRGAWFKAIHCIFLDGGLSSSFKSHFVMPSAHAPAEAQKRNSTQAVEQRLQNQVAMFLLTLSMPSSYRPMQWIPTRRWEQLHIPRTASSKCSAQKSPSPRLQRTNKSGSTGKLVPAHRGSTPDPSTLNLSAS